MSPVDFLTPIIERKRREVARRKRHRGAAPIHRASAADGGVDRGELARRALRRAPGQRPVVIAEFKRSSPSAGVIRPKEPRDVERISQAYVAAGAAAVSVLCDGPGFCGTPLDVRRAARAINVPLLFKEFVVDEIQIDLARSMGAHMVLLLVRVLSDERLRELVDATLARGLAPVVEAADSEEVERAVATRATIIGINARDLRTFRVSLAAAQDAIDRIPLDRIAVHMSGVHSREDFARIAATRADALLIGEGLMRASAPGQRLRELLGA